MQQKLLQNKRVLRLSFLALIAGFCLTLLAAGIPASRAYADGPCVVRGPFTTITDSYGHDEGVLSFHHNYCLDTTWATFLSNTNTWQSVVVTFVTGYHFAPGDYPVSHSSRTYNWQANTNFNSPMIAGAACNYLGEILLVDNRGNEIGNGPGALTSGEYVGGVFGYCFQ